MIEFLKSLLSKVNFKSENKDLNKYNKIIYTVIILCAVFFVGFIIYFVIKQLPDITDSIQTAWNDSKTLLNKNLK